MTAFDPLGEHHARCQDYLSRSLGGRARLVQAEPLTKSTREAPWRLDAEIDGEMRSYVLRLGPAAGEHEYEVLRAMESVPVPTPRVYGWDSRGESLGAPCFLSDFIPGGSLLPPLLAAEPWAEDLFLDSVAALQSVSRHQLASVASRLGSGETAEAVLERIRDYFVGNPLPLAEAVYRKMKRPRPDLPAVRFSNGDLYPDNLLARDRRLAGVIDFENAGFSDPIYEFLLPFFLHFELRGRGTEERYCRRMGFDPDLLPWYRGLEYFGAWHWVLKTGQPFEPHTAESLEAALEGWLSSG